MTLREAAKAAMEEQIRVNKEAERYGRAERTALMVKDMLGFDATPNPDTGTATADGIEFRLRRDDGITHLHMLQPCDQCGATVPMYVYDLISLGSALETVPICDHCRSAQWYNAPTDDEASPAAIKLAQALMDALRDLQDAA